MFHKSDTPAALPVGKAYPVEKSFERLSQSLFLQNYHEEYHK